MQSFGPKVTLERFRQDALHREAMCTAIASEESNPDAPKFAAIATMAQKNLTSIDARMADVRRANDLVTRARALERVRKLYARKAYEQVRLDLAAKAATLYRVLLPVAPSSVGKANIKDAATIIEQAIANLRGDDTPESIRAEHVPVLERELQRLREADLAEDTITANFAAVRAAIVLFKANLERQRQSQYGQIVDLVGKPAAEEFFLPAYTRTRNDDTDEGDEGADEVG